MSKEVQQIKPNELTIQDVKQYVCPDATEKEIFLFLQIAKSCNLNPFLSQIYLVKYGTQKAQILTSYNVYLQRAEKSKKYAGLETSTVGSVKTGDLKGVVKVFRKDWKNPLIHEVHYDEYVQRKKDGSINKFWREKPRTMIVKVAISQAFRLAFPMDFEGMPYTQDEMNTIDVSPESKKEPTPMPKATQNKPEVEVSEAKINEPAQSEVEDATFEEPTTEQSEAVSKEKMAKSKKEAMDRAKNLVEVAKKSGYTHPEVLEIIAYLGYTMVIDVSGQDYDTIMEEVGKSAASYREKKELLAKESKSA